MRRNNDPGDINLWGRLFIGPFLNTTVFHNRGEVPYENQDKICRKLIGYKRICAAAAKLPALHL